jgi:hypothetical protein
MYEFLVRSAIMMPRTGASGRWERHGRGHLKQVK